MGKGGRVGREEEGEEGKEGEEERQGWSRGQGEKFIRIRERIRRDTQSFNLHGNSEKFYKFKSKIKQNERKEKFKIDLQK